MKKVYYIFLKFSAVRLVQDVVIFLLLACLFYYGACWYRNGAGSDALIYQCYAVAFWQGPSELDNLPSGQCTFINYSDKYTLAPLQQELLHVMQQHRLPFGLIQFVGAQSTNNLYHALPYEYPLPSLLPFSLGLLTPAKWYQAAFATWMILISACIYFILQHWQSRKTAITYILYLMFCGWATAGARFDLIPAALTLFAVICAEHKRWNWTFVLLALATVSKLYPIILLIPFLLALHQGTQEKKWYEWHKWLPMGLFMGVCTLVISISLFLNVAGTLMPLEYFVNRPVEVESVSASLLWIYSLLEKTSLTYATTFGALNVLSTLSTEITSRMIILLIIGLLYTWWLQWQKRIDLAMACLLTLLIVIVTGKVFSPQYLIWVIPLAAYVEPSNRRWILFWIGIGLLTSCIYPYIFHIFHMNPDTYALLFQSITAVRNFLLLGFVFSILVSVSRKRIKQPSYVFAIAGRRNPG